MFTAAPRRLATAWTTGMNALDPEKYTVFAPVGHAAAAAWPETATTAPPSKHAVTRVKQMFFLCMTDCTLLRAPALAPAQAGRNLPLTSLRSCEVNATFVCQSR